MRDVVTENWLKAEVLGSRSRPKGTQGQWRSPGASSGEKSFAGCIDRGVPTRFRHFLRRFLPPRRMHPSTTPHWAKADRSSITRCHRGASGRNNALLAGARQYRHYPPADHPLMTFWGIVFSIVRRVCCTSSKAEAEAETTSGASPNGSGGNTRDSRDAPMATITRRSNSRGTSMAVSSSAGSPSKPASHRKAMPPFLSTAQHVRGRSSQRSRLLLRRHHHAELDVARNLASRPDHARQGAAVAEVRVEHRPQLATDPQHPPRLFEQL
jgi:transposase